MNESTNSQSWTAPSGHAYVFAKLDEAIDEQASRQGIDLRATMADGAEISELLHQVQDASASPEIQIYSRSS